MARRERERERDAKIILFGMAERVNKITGGSEEEKVNREMERDVDKKEY